MRQRAVIVLTFHFPPSAASGTHRVLGLSQFLPKCGWDVRVIAPTRVAWESLDEALVSRIPDSTIVYRTNIPSGLLSKPFRKWFPYAAWFPRAIRSFRQAYCETRPDVVFTSGPPHSIHLLGMAIGRWYGIPWVADFRDPWVTGNFLALKKLYKRWGPVLERKVFASANAIVLNAPNAKRAVDARFPQHAHKTHCVTNGFDPEQFSDIAHQQRPGKFVITHAGELYAGRDPRPFLNAVQRIITATPSLRQKLVVEFVGECNQRELSLSEEIKVRQLADVVQVIGQVSYRDSLARMVNSDLLLLIDTPDRTLGVPAKVYEYLGAKRPILALGATPSDVSWVLKESGVRHLLVGCSDTDAIEMSLRSVLDVGASVPCDGEGVLAFSREVVARNMAMVMNGLFAAKGGLAREIRVPAVKP